MFSSVLNTPLNFISVKNPDQSLYEAMSNLSDAQFLSRSSIPAMRVKGVLNCKT